MSICDLNQDNYCERHRRVHRGRELQLCLLDNNEGEAYRQAWDKLLRQPSMSIPAVDFLNSLQEFILAGAPKVTDAQYAERISICDKCTEYVDKSIETWRCKICGCNLQEGPILPGRARWATKDCPYPSGSKWPKIELPTVLPPRGKPCCNG